MEKRPITIDDLARIRTASDPQMSPDGSRIAYVVKTMDREKNKYFSHIWAVSTAPPSDGGGPPRQWTHSKESEGSPRWSPDGRWLAFTSGREEKKGQIYLLPTDGGEARKVTDLPAGSVEGLCWSPDGTRIAFLFRPQDEEWREEAVEERKKKSLSTPVREITRLHYRSEGVGFVPRERYQIHVLSVEGIADSTASYPEVRAITSGERDHASLSWSPDSTRIAYVQNVADDPDLMPNSDALFVLPADGLAEGEEPIRLNAPLGPKYSPAWSPDGRFIAYMGHDRPEETWGVADLHVWIVPVNEGGDAPGGEPARDLTPEWDVTVGSAAIGDVNGSGEGGPVWSGDSRSVLILASQKGTVEVYRASTDSEGAAATPKRLTEGVHAITGFSSDAKRESLALLLTTPHDAGDLYAMQVGSPFFRRLTRLNDDLFQEVELASPIAFDAPTNEGHTVPCWAVLPHDGEESRTPRPTILYIHGGPHAMYTHALFHEYQALAAAGYVVLYPNPRGSKGYGEAWTGAIRGNWGEPAQADCLACIDYAVKQKWADKKRLGVAGGSYGGYLTGWIVGHSDRFAAAVAERGVFNLQSMAGTCDFVWRDDGQYFAGNATGDPSGYLKNSPLTYADAIKTPLLIIHSEGDLRCPIEQAEQLFAALKRLGREVVFLRYGPESNHNLSRSGPPDLRIDRQKRIHAWFDKYLKPE